MLPLASATYLGLTIDQLITLLVMIWAFVSFVRGRIAPEIVALSSMGILILTGVLPVVDKMVAGDIAAKVSSGELPAGERVVLHDAASAFSDNSVLMIAAMLILCTALERTGVVARLGDFYEKAAGTNPARGLWVLMLTCGTLSAFLNNTSLVVIFLPIVMAVCRRQNVPPSRLLIPLSFATVGGGMITTVGTSTNLNVVKEAADKGVTFNSLFEIAPLGLVVYAIMLVYLAWASKRLLPDRVALSTMLDENQAREYLTRAFVAPDSTLVGQLYAKTQLSRARGMRLIEVLRDGVIVQSDYKELVLQPGDQLILKGRLEDVMQVRETEGIVMVPQDSLGLERVKTEKAVLMEAVLGPGSSLLHKSLKQLNFRQKYGVIIVAMHRMGVNLRERFEDTRFMLGDALLLEGPPEQMNQLFKERGFINLTKPKDTRPRVEKATLAIVLMSITIFFGALSEMPVWGGGSGSILRYFIGFDLGFTGVAMVGAILTVLTRCLDPGEVYETMEWRLLFMIIGMIGVGAAMERCGLSLRLADGFVQSFSGLGPWAMLSAIYLFSVIMTEFLSNNAVAIVLTPIAISTAHLLHVDPKPFAVAVMFGATLAFSTPIGYQTNLLVYNAGGYKFSDFARIGVPLTIILWIVCSLLIPVIWPF